MRVKGLLLFLNGVERSKFIKPMANDHDPSVGDFCCCIAYCPDRYNSYLNSCWLSSETAVPS